MDVASGVVTCLALLTRVTDQIRIRGDEALVAGFDGTVQLWDLRARTNRVIATHQSRVRDAQFSPDGTRIASCGDDGRVSISTSDGLLLSRQVGGVATQLTFTVDGKSVIFGHDDGRVWRWDLGSGRLTLLGRHGAAVFAVVRSGNGTWAATASADRTVRLWNLRDGTTQVLAGHGGAVWDLSFSPDDSLLASGSEDGTIRLWRLGSDAASVLRGHSSGVQAVSFSRDGRWLVSSADDQSTRVWDLRGARAVNELVGHVGDAASVVYSPDGNWLASSGLDGTVRLWTLPEGKAGAVHNLGYRVDALAFSPDSARVAAGADHSIDVWDTRSGNELLRDRVAEMGPVSRLRFSPEGRRLAASSLNGFVRVWTDGVGSNLAGARAAVRALSFSPDGRLLAAGGDDELVHIWDLTSGAVRVDTFLSGDVIMDLAFAPDGKALASALWLGGVRVRDLAGDSSQTLTTSGKADSVTFSLSGRWLAIGGVDNTVTLWDRRTSTQRVLRGFDKQVWNVHFSPSEKLVVAAGNSTTVRVWDVASGDIQRLYRSDSGTNYDALSFDGATIATTHKDGVVRLWPMPREYVATTASALREAMERLTTAVLTDSPPVPQTK
jgi:WD40 repeat protein